MGEGLPIFYVVQKAEGTPRQEISKKPRNALWQKNKQNIIYGNKPPCARAPHQLTYAYVEVTHRNRNKKNRQKCRKMYGMKKWATTIDCTYWWMANGIRKRQTWRIFQLMTNHRLNSKETKNNMHIDTRFCNFFAYHFSLAFVWHV